MNFIELEQTTYMFKATYRFLHICILSLPLNQLQETIFSTDRRSTEPRQKEKFTCVSYNDGPWVTFTFNLRTLKWQESVK